MDMMTVKRFRNGYSVIIDERRIGILFRTKAGWWAVLEWDAKHAEQFRTFGEAVEYIKIEATVKELEDERHEEKNNHFD